MAPNKKQLKLIELLDRSIQLTREFMNDWLLFNQILSAYPSPGVNKAQLENQFLKIKSKLARGHQVLRESLGADYKFDSNTMNIVSGATNLESIYSQSEVAIKKLQNEWHRAFIAINETLGGLEDKKVRAEGGENVVVGNMVITQKAGMSKGTKQGLIFLLVVGVLGGLGYVFKVHELYLRLLGGATPPAP
ncbi:MAG: hypothetical protein SGI88_08400 [Candidatus Hydrogenedentes bacterium]|nr:hypothetical protein [Candidatus Hydrogenedentota bacterium]